MADERITIYDDLGRAHEVDSEEWESSLLPELLERAWSSGEELYRWITIGIDTGSAGGLVEAARRLLELEGPSERSTAAYAIIAMENGELDRAQHALESYCSTEGPTGLILTNLAKVAAARGEEARATTVLRNALQLDPNQSSGLDWWGAMHHERGGEDAFLDAMREVAGFARSWRPQLWLARNHLEQGRVDEALRLYEAALDHCAREPDAITMISGDLGVAAMSRELLDLLEPLFDVATHGPLAGMNLVRAMIDEGRLGDARQILDQVQELQVPQVAAAITSLEEELAIASGLPDATSGEASVVLVEGPIWTRGIAEVAELLPLPVPASERVFCVSLADTTRQGCESGSVERVTDFGRFARSLPLYLAESLRFTTDAAACAFVPIMANIGPILAGDPWDLDWLLRACPFEELPNLVIHGALTEHGGNKCLSVAIEDWHGRTEVARLDFAVEPPYEASAGTIVRSVTDALERAGRARRRHRRGAFVEPREEHLEHYLTALGNLLAQELVRNGLAAPERILNERGLLRSYFELAEAMDGAPIPQLMAIRGVLSAMSYGSRVARHFSAAARRIVENCGANSPVAALAPLVERSLGGEAGGEAI